MSWSKISDAVIRRLPLYLRVLDESSADQVELISSQELGYRIGVGSALVRKDLAWFGEFGKQGVGYEVDFLRHELRKILNLDQELNIALVGVGSLGVALGRYHLKRFAEDEEFNLRLVALFDNDPRKIGTSVEGVQVYDLTRLTELVPSLNIKMAIITVPAENAQIVAEQLVKSGIKGILNFAPTKIVVPEDVHVSSADLTLEMQRLAYYLPE
ncbi:MAG: redox-sensing transcriptional repressor Rex [Firmicutes bacterium]|nr:redox-sensing transcriptional repressor Rex [Bacillota bacterium]